MSVSGLGPFAPAVLMVLLACGAPDATPEQAVAITDSSGFPATGAAPVAGFDTTSWANASYAHTVIDNADGTFGYEIQVDGQPVIRQSNVPGRPGLAGCATREQAAALAALVIGKIRKGYMPPTVEQAELKELGLVP